MANKIILKFKKQIQPEIIKILIGNVEEKSVKCNSIQNYIFCNEDIYYNLNKCDTIKVTYVDNDTNFDPYENMSVEIDFIVVRERQKKFLESCQEKLSVDDVVKLYHPEL